MIWIIVLLALGLFTGSALLLWGTRWGSTPDERTLKMPGDDYLEDHRGARVVMTRAISISAPPERVWPWISQLGRGAGWYSIDWLDNGRKVSAWHIVSWIPEPQLGDATAIGYLRHVNTGQSLAWWLDGTKSFGAQARMVTCFSIGAEGQGTRLISRISADATGPIAHITLMAFRVIDSIMASRQLIGLRDRIEYCEEGNASQRNPETGDRAQYQLYEILFANGDRAGVAGKEDGVMWRQSAIRDGIIKEGE
jgi:hypothetical protein